GVVPGGAVDGVDAVENPVPPGGNPDVVVRGPVRVAGDQGGDAAADVPRPVRVLVRPPAHPAGQVRRGRQGGGGAEVARDGGEAPRGGAGSADGRREAVGGYPVGARGGGFEGDCGDTLGGGGADVVGRQCARPPAGPRGLPQLRLRVRDAVGE